MEKHKVENAPEINGYKEYLTNQKERLKELYPENNIGRLDVNDPRFWFFNQSKDLRMDRKRSTLKAGLLKKLD